MKSKGFTLIEALVALLVISIGMLGLAAMSIKSLQSSHASYNRSLATLVALDVREKAWLEYLEKSGVCDEVDESAFVDELNSYWSGDSGEEPWDVLPGLDIAVAESSCEVTVTVSWTESRFGLAGDQESFVYSMMLPSL